MATAKKTPAKPAHRTDYKADSRVKFTNRLGVVVPARTTGEIVRKQTGPFIEINTGDKKNPVLRWARPAQLKGY